MLNFATGQRLYGTSSVTTVTYTVEGKTYAGTTVENGILAQGTFSGTRLLYTAPSRAEFNIYITNPNISSTLVTLYVGGALADNQVFQGTLEPNWSLSYTDDWQIYDENGLPVTNGNFTDIIISSTPPINPSLGDLWIDIS